MLAWHWCPLRRGQWKPPLAEATSSGVENGPAIACDSVQMSFVEMEDRLTGEFSEGPGRHWSPSHERLRTQPRWCLHSTRSKNLSTKHASICLGKSVRPCAIASTPSRPRERRLGRRGGCRVFSPCGQDGRRAKPRRAFSELALVQGHIKCITVRHLVLAGFVPSKE